MLVKAQIPVLHLIKYLLKTITSLIQNLNSLVIIVMNYVIFSKIVPFQKLVFFVMAAVKKVLSPLNAMFVNFLVRKTKKGDSGF